MVDRALLVSAFPLEQKFRMRWSRRMAVAVGAVVVLLLSGSPAVAAGGDDARGGGARHGVKLEKLDRGLVVVPTSEGNFLSWRLLGDEATGHSASGVTGSDFNVYRDGRRIATVTDSTNYVDKTGTATSK